jgi:hypothetical protein
VDLFNRTASLRGFEELVAKLGRRANGVGVDGKAITLFEIRTDGCDFSI